jgi:hypothetical protein
MTPADLSRSMTAASALGVDGDYLVPGGGLCEQAIEHLQLLGFGIPTVCGEVEADRPGLLHRHSDTTAISGISLGLAGDVG